MGNVGTPGRSNRDLGVNHSHNRAEFVSSTRLSVVFGVVSGFRAGLERRSCGPRFTRGHLDLEETSKYLSTPTEPGPSLKGLAVAMKRQ